MAMKACYVPMFNPGYKGQKIHRLAIRGKSAFQELEEYVHDHPRCVYSRDSENNTALLLACAAHHQPYDSVRHLLKAALRGKKQLVRAENQDGLTALHIAVLNDRPDIVKLLLENGVEVNAGVREISGTKYGLTPLHLTLIDHCSSARCFHLLLRHGADHSVQMVQSTLSSECATFRFECHCGGCWSRDMFLDCFVPPAWISRDALLDDIDWDVPARQTAIGPAICFAVRNEAHSQVETLLERFYPDAHHDPLVRSLLGTSVSCINSYTAQLLLDWGADVNYSADGVSPLLKFLSHDRENIACDWCDRQKPYDSAWADPFLDSEDVDIHVKTTRGESPLWVAAAEGYADDCKRLVEKGGNPLDVDHAGRTALRQACLLDSEPLRWRIVSILLSTGIGRDLVHETFDEDTSVLGAVYDRTDSRTLELLHLAGAIHRDSLRLMVGRAASEVCFFTEADKVKMGEFRRRVEDALTTVRPLLDTCVIRLSSLAGVAPPARRAQVLEAMDPDPDRVCWSLMKGHFRFAALVPEGDA